MEASASDHFMHANVHYVQPVEDIFLFCQWSEQEGREGPVLDRSLSRPCPF